MTKVKCKLDKEADVIIDDQGKVGCPNLKHSHVCIRESWCCKITGKPCGYNMYKTPQYNTYID